MHWREPLTVKAICAAANAYAAVTLANHLEYARMTGLASLAANIEWLQTHLAAAQEDGSSCLIALGWGTGLLGKSAWPRVADESYRRVMAKAPFYARAIKTGFPFPKTRRVAFLGGTPGALPGWVRLEAR